MRKSIERCSDVRNKTPTLAAEEQDQVLDRADKTASVRVLLVGGPQAFSLCRQHLEMKGCQSEFADYDREVWAVLKQKQFDIVLSVYKNQPASTQSLGVLLTGSRTSLFYALPVERGCWWVPILRIGEECSGAPALRPIEFVGVLDGLVDEIKAQAEVRSNHDANRAVDEKQTPPALVHPESPGTPRPAQPHRAQDDDVRENDAK